jgi:hypothetical protein
MLTFDPDARRARIARPGEAPIDGQLVCYYPCPRCPNAARALVYLGDAGLTRARRAARRLNRSMTFVVRTQVRKENAH